MVTSRFPRDTSRLPANETALAQWLPKLLTAAAIGIGAWLGTEWFWYVSSASLAGANRPSGPAAIKPRPNIAASAETLASTRLFGGQKPTAAVVAQTTSLNIKLKGVFAGDPSRPAFAIVNTGSRDEFALAGRELIPGVLLESVHATHVLLKRNGLTERVNLEQRSLAAAGGPRPSPVLMAPRPVPRVAPPEPPAAPPTAAPPPPPGAPTMQPGGQPGAMNFNPQTNHHFGRIGMRPEGVAVENAPPGSVLANLGLQPGDVIRSVNGQAITSEADLARVYQQSASSPSVQAEITRDGKTFPMQVTVRR